jgi:putative ABC transport system permease protein
MALLEAFHTAFRALLTNRLRSLLTVLGIVFGIAAVICMVAVSEGARSQITEKIRRLGSNLLFIFPYPPSTGTPHALTEDDASAILREVAGVQISAPIIWGGKQAVAGNKNWPTTVWGNNSDYLLAREWPISSGRMFNAQEIASGSKVAILGGDLADKLFSEEPPIGKTVRLGVVPFTVIGVLERKGQVVGLGTSQDDMVFVPLWAARSRLLGSRFESVKEEGAFIRKNTDNKDDNNKVREYDHESRVEALDYLVVKHEPSASPEQVKQGIEEVLRRRHRLGNGMPNDFGILNPADALAAEESSARSFGLLLLAIASISLLVGGISIMNTMVISVTERTREIGLRMAIGARRQDIRNQFLIEAAVLALLGGVIGIAAGAVGATAIAQYGEWPVVISPGIILLAFVFASLIGVVFGLLPAYRAAKLDPMIALRFE